MQPGIGTYNKRQFITRTVSVIASVIDQGVALHLNDHVKEGFVYSEFNHDQLLKAADRYQFVMRNYRLIYTTIACSTI